MMEEKDRLVVIWHWISDGHVITKNNNSFFILLSIIIIVIHIFCKNKRMIINKYIKM